MSCCAIPIYILAEVHLTDDGEHNESYGSFNKKDYDDGYPNAKSLYEK